MRSSTEIAQEPPKELAPQREDPSRADLEARIEAIRARIAEGADTHDDWARLCVTLVELGRCAEAVAAYGNVAARDRRDVLPTLKARCGDAACRGLPLPPSEAHRRPWADLVRYPFRGDGIWVLGSGAAFFAAAATVIPWMGFVVAAAAFAFHAGTVLRSTLSGRDHPPDFEELPALALGSGVLPIAIVLSCPVITFAIACMPGAPFADLVPPLAIVAVACALIGPFLAAAASRYGLLAALAQPTVWLAPIARRPVDALATVLGVWLALTVAILALVGAARAGLLAALPLGVAAQLGFVVAARRLGLWARAL